MRPWKTNAFGVFGKFDYCIPSLFCPSFAYYSISELFEVPPASLAESCAGGYCLCFGFLIRTRLRNRYNLDGSILGDFLAHLFCHCIALARIWREAEIQTRTENKSNIPSPQPSPPPLQMFPINAEHGMPLKPQPYLPIGGGCGLGFYDAPNVARPMIRHNRGRTVDTSLSGFDQDGSSHQREDSMDPPPSNTDTNPWDMMQGRTRGEDPSRSMLQAGVQRLPVMAQQESSKKPISREDYLKYITNKLDDPSGGRDPPGTSGEIDCKSNSKDLGSDDVQNSGQTDLTRRWAILRPPGSSALQTTQEEDSEAADRIILEADSMAKWKSVEDELFNR